MDYCYHYFLFFRTWHLYCLFPSIICSWREKKRFVLWPPERHEEFWGRKPFRDSVLSDPVFLRLLPRSFLCCSHLLPPLSPSLVEEIKPVDPWQGRFDSRCLQEIAITVITCEIGIRKMKSERGGTKENVSFGTLYAGRNAEHAFVDIFGNEPSHYDSRKHRKGGFQKNWAIVTHAITTCSLNQTYTGTAAKKLLLLLLEEVWYTGEVAVRSLIEEKWFISR